MISTPPLDGNPGVRRPQSISEHRGPFLGGLALVLVFGLLTAFLTYPLSLHPATFAQALSADTRLFLWTVSWDVHALFSHPFSLFEANIFYPEHHTLAYSEHLLGSAVLAAPFLLATGNPLLGLNAVVLLSCVLSGIGASFLARKVGASWEGAFVTGVIFAFAPPRFFRLGQLHLATVEWIPFTLAMLHQYADRRERSALLVATALFTLQSLTSGHGGLFLALAAGGLLAYLGSTSRLPNVGAFIRDLGWGGTLLLLSNLVFLWPYFEVRRTVGLHRSLGAVEDWSPNLASFLMAPTHVGLWLYGPDRVGTARAFLFPGFVTLFLSFVSLKRRSPPEEKQFPSLGSARLLVFEGAILLAFLGSVWISSSGGFEANLLGLSLSARSPIRALLAGALLLVLRVVLFPKTPSALLGAMRWAGTGVEAWSHSRMGAPGGFYLVLAILSFWASLGPRFFLYTLLYRLVPGFDLVRVPSRLSLLTLLSLAVLAGLGLDSLARKEGRRIGGALFSLACVFEFAACPLPARQYTIPRPALEGYIATLKDGAPIVELPIVDPKDSVGSARLHSLYMLYSLAHFHPMVNGYSGFVPSRHEEIFATLKDFPDEASLRTLEGLGVAYAVVHPGLYPMEEWERVSKRLESFPGRLHLDRAEGGDRLYVLAEVRR